MPAFATNPGGDPYNYAQYKRLRTKITRYHDGKVFQGWSHDQVQKKIDAYQRGIKQKFISKAEQERAQKVRAWMKNGQVKKAITFMEVWAKAGSWFSLNKLADMHMNGDGVERDYKTALKWLYVAARRGSSAATFTIARMYLNGWGVPKNPDQATYWLKIGKSDPVSLYALGRLYCLGIGVPRDYREALAQFARAADKDYPRAHSAVGEMFYLGRGVRRNYRKALQCFEDAARKTDPRGQFYLGEMYANGIGVKKSAGEGDSYLNAFKKQLDKSRDGKLDDFLANLERQELLKLEKRLNDPAAIEAQLAPPAADQEVAKQNATASGGTDNPIPNSVASKSEEKNDTNSPETNAACRDIESIYKDLEVLVKKFFPKATIDRDGKTMTFEYKARTIESHLTHEKTRIPSRKGICGDVSLVGGPYKGHRKVPFQLNEGDCTLLLLAPYSKAGDCHLLANLRYPPYADGDFVNGFKKLIGSFNSAP